MRYKACSRCGRIHPEGYNCTVGQVYKWKATPDSKLRSTYAWQLKREEIRDKAYGLCEVCADKGVYTYDGIEVHHIDKLRDRPDELLDNNNLVCLCKTHHKAADEGLIDKDYLRALAKKREEGEGQIAK